MNGQAPVHILVVEDDPWDQKLLQRCLSSSHEVVFCPDGEIAKTFLEEMERDERPWVSLVLLDLNLPRLDGNELLAWIRSRPRLYPLVVLVLTTSSSTHDVWRAYDLGANTFLTKPMELRAFQKLINVVESFWLRTATLPSSSGMPR